MPLEGAQVFRAQVIQQFLRLAPIASRLPQSGYRTFSKSPHDARSVVWRRHSEDHRGAVPWSWRRDRFVNNSCSAIRVQLAQEKGGINCAGINQGWLHREHDRVAVLRRKGSLCMNMPEKERNTFLETQMSPV